VPSGVKRLAAPASNAPEPQKTNGYVNEQTNIIEVYTKLIVARSRRNCRAGTLSSTGLKVDVSLLEGLMGGHPGRQRAAPGMNSSASVLCLRCCENLLGTRRSASRSPHINVIFSCKVGAALSATERSPLRRPLGLTCRFSLLNTTPRISQRTTYQLG
jgi:hypothetical protein